MWRKVLPRYDTKEVTKVPGAVNVTVNDTVWSLKRALLEVTLPVFLGILMALPIYLSYKVFNTNEPVITPIVKTPQIPVNRDLVVRATTIDDRDFIVTVKGRQVDNYEENQWCEHAWTGSIIEMISRAGTVNVGGQYHLDDFIAEQENGIEESIRQSLTGQSLKSDNCRFDILSIQLQEAR